MPLETLLPEIYKLIQSLVNNEPNDSARERMEKLLSSEIGENSEE